MGEGGGSEPPLFLRSATEFEGILVWRGACWPLAPGLSMYQGFVSRL